MVTRFCETKTPWWLFFVGQKPSKFQVNLCQVNPNYTFRVDFDGVGRMTLLTWRGSDRRFLVTAAFFEAKLNPQT